jgi:hypothetical protein
MTLTTHAHPGLDEIDGRRLLAVALTDQLRQLDELADGASADTWSVEHAIDDAEAVLAAHAGELPEPAARAIEQAITRIGEALEWGLEITIPGTPYAYTDGLKAADDVLDRLAADGYRLVKADRR